MKTTMLVISLLATLAILPGALAAGSYFSGGFFYPKQSGSDSYYMSGYSGMNGYSGMRGLQGYNRLPVVNGMQWINAPNQYGYSNGYSLSGMNSYGAGTNFASYNGFSNYGSYGTQFSRISNPMQETVFQAATLPETHQEVFSDVMKQRNVVTIQNQVHNIWPITRVHHKTNYATRTTSSTRVQQPSVVDIPEGTEAQNVQS